MDAFILGEGGGGTQVCSEGEVRKGPNLYNQKKSN